MHFSKIKSVLVLFGGLIMLLQLSSCKDDQIDLTDTPLKGTINGQEWEYKFGNRTFYSGQKYRFLLLSTKEAGEEPCSIVSSSNPHIQMVLELRTGSYSIPFSDFFETVRFVLGDGSELIATSGFVEVFTFDGRYMIGYIQAIFDDDNTVEGSFRVELC